MYSCQADPLVILAHGCPLIFNTDQVAHFAQTEVGDNQTTDVYLVQGNNKLKGIVQNAYIIWVHASEESMKVWMFEVYCSSMCTFHMH